MRRLLPVEALIVLATACGGEPEEAVPSGTPIESVAPSPGETTGTSPTRPAVPADWNTLTSSDGSFAIRYPPDWVAVGNDSLVSNNPPVGGSVAIELEISVSPTRGADVCGPILDIDQATGEVIGLLPGATPWELGGIEGGWIVRGVGDPA